MGGSWDGVGREGGREEVFGEELVTSAMRAKRWSGVSTKRSCLPFESYEHDMAVMPKHGDKMNVLDVMMTLGDG
jgi:hypothetical protein